MTLRTVMIVLLALLCGGSAAVGVNILVNQKGGAPPVETIGVVVAIADVPRGTNLISEQLVVRPWPKALQPPGAINRIEEVVDRVTFVALTKDEPVLEGELAPRNSGRGLAALVPKGFRAFTIHAASHIAAGVAGFVLPGNKVDILLTVADGGANDSSGGGSTLTLLQNIEVLAVDQRLDAPAANKVDPKELRSVTLLVTPVQAAKLDLAQSKGTLHLSLRNPDDTEDGRTVNIPWKQLRFEQEKPNVAPVVIKEAVKTEPEPPRKVHVMTISSGFNTSRHEFPVAEVSPASVSKQK